MRSAFNLPTVAPSAPGRLSLPKDRTPQPAYWASVRCFDEHPTDALRRTWAMYGRRPEAHQPNFSYVRRAYQNLGAELARREQG